MRRKLGPVTIYDSDRNEVERRHYINSRKPRPRVGKSRFREQDSDLGVETPKMRTIVNQSRMRFASKTRSPPSKRRRLVGRSKIIWADSDSEDVSVRNENAEKQPISADEKFVVKDPFTVEGEIQWGNEDFSIEDTSRSMEKPNSESDHHAIEEDEEAEEELDPVVEMERWNPGALAQYRLNYPDCLIEPVIKKGELRQPLAWIKCHDCPEKIWHPAENNFVRHLESERHVGNQRGSLKRKGEEKQLPSSPQYIGNQRARVLKEKYEERERRKPVRLDEEGDSSTPTILKPSSQKRRSEKTQLLFPSKFSSPNNASQQREHSSLEPDNVFQGSWRQKLERIDREKTARITELEDRNKELERSLKPLQNANDMDVELMTTLSKWAARKNGE